VCKFLHRELHDPATDYAIVNKHGAEDLTSNSALKFVLAAPSHEREE
jgi:hypothetical protein